jgi:triosephosphate isomerase
MDTSRKVFIGGNWKSNNTLKQSQLLVENVINKLDFDPARTGIPIL